MYPILILKGTVKYHKKSTSSLLLFATDVNLWSPSPLESDKNSAIVLLSSILGLLAIGFAE